MPTPPSLTEKQLADIAEDEATLDRLYPDWRLSQTGRARKGGFGALPPAIVADVKRALKRRQLRKAGRNNDVQIVWAPGKGPGAPSWPYAHAMQDGAVMRDLSRLSSAIDTDPELRELLTARGLL
jgi:hypothetical protein